MSAREVIPPYGPGYDPAGPRLEGWQVARVAANAGFNETLVPGHAVSNLVMAVAIAKRESNWTVNIQNAENYPYYGLWQIGVPLHTDLACATNAWCSAQLTWKLSGNGTNFFGPWQYPPSQADLDAGASAALEMRRRTEREQPKGDERMALTVIDFKHAGTPKGRSRFVEMRPDDAQKRFLLIVRNGAKIQGHPVGGYGVAVTQASNGKLLGVQAEPDGVHFVVTADDGGTFRYAFEK